MVELKMMSELTKDEKKDIIGGCFGGHVIQPAPGTCSCNSGNPWDIQTIFWPYDGHIH